MNRLDALPCELVAHIHTLVQRQVHAELIGELERIHHAFNDDDGIHTIDFSGLDYGVKYMRMMNPLDGTRREVAVQSTHYLDPCLNEVVFDSDHSEGFHGPLGATVVVESISGEHFRVL